MPNEWMAPSNVSGSRRYLCDFSAVSLCQNGIASSWNRCFCLFSQYLCSHRSAVAHVCNVAKKGVDESVDVSVPQHRMSTSARELPMRGRTVEQPDHPDEEVEDTPVKPIVKITAALRGPKTEGNEARLLMAYSRDTLRPQVSLARFRGGTGRYTRASEACRRGGGTHQPHGRHHGAYRRTDDGRCSHAVGSWKHKGVVQTIPQDIPECITNQIVVHQCRRCGSVVDNTGTSATTAFTSSSRVFVFRNWYGWIPLAARLDTP